MKQVIERIKQGNSASGIPYTMTLTLSCGHQIIRGEAGNGGFQAYTKAKYQKKAKCPICDEEA